MSMASETDSLRSSHDMIYLVFSTHDCGRPGNKSTSGKVHSHAKCMHMHATNWTGSFVGVGSMCCDCR